MSQGRCRKGILKSASCGFGVDFTALMRALCREGLCTSEGPEIFMPSQSGQIINSRRTQEILYDIKRRAGSDATGRGMANTIIVNEIRAHKSINRNTRMSVDTFAGVV